ncbi:MAG: hypothetical protein V3S55_13975 [Nitrospiraceae bacterium]
MNWAQKTAAEIWPRFSGNAHDRRIQRRWFQRLYWFKLLRNRMWSRAWARLLHPRGYLESRVDTKVPLVLQWVKRRER